MDDREVNRRRVPKALDVFPLSSTNDDDAAFADAPPPSSRTTPPFERSGAPLLCSLPPLPRVLDDQKPPSPPRHRSRVPLYLGFRSAPDASHQAFDAFGPETPLSTTPPHHEVPPDSHFRLTKRPRWLFKAFVSANQDGAEFRRSPARSSSLPGRTPLSRTRLRSPRRSLPAEAGGVVLRRIAGLVPLFFNKEALS